MTEKELLEQVAIAALAVPFDEGLDQAGRDAVTDHMIAVEEAIRNFRPASGHFVATGEHD